MKTCDKCQINKHCIQLKIKKLMPLLIPKQNFHSVSMDFITGIPNVKAFNVIMVVMCQLN